MPEIKFTATPVLPFDIVHLDYKAGDVVDLPEASCRRWIRRGVAEYHVAAKVSAKEPAKIAVEAPKVVEETVETAVDESTTEPEVFAGVQEDEAPKRRGRPRKED